MQESATLNVYHRRIMKSKKSTSRKSVTFPNANLSTRFPKAPLKIKVKAIRGNISLFMMKRYTITRIAAKVKMRKNNLLKLPEPMFIPNTAPGLLILVKRKKFPSISFDSPK